jgi:hypothetical protein
MERKARKAGTNVKRCFLVGSYGKAISVQVRRNRGGPQLSALVFAVAIIAVVAVVYWPGIHGYWGRDDYFQLAFARLIGSPWPLFLHDHFPVPGSVFRPLGFASMWLSEQLFGSNYKAHALADLGLHAGVALALFGVLRRAAIPLLPAALCTLLFAVHPVAIGTALWWSARFDLLATLFVLLALHAGLVYRDTKAGTALAAALGAALAAMLCKEIGLVAVVALSLPWLRWAWREPGDRARALRAVALACACAGVYLGWRWAVLGTVSSSLTGAMPIADAVVAGIVDWSRHAPAYLSFWPRLDLAQRMGIGVALAVVIPLALSALRRARSSPPGSVDLLLCGMCLLLLPALLQAPVAALNAEPLRTDVSAIETAMQSRLYYLALVGAALALAPLLTRLLQAPPLPRGLAAFSLLLALAAFAVASRDDAHAFAQRSFAISGVARDAVAAVAKLDLPASGCHVVFLGIEPPPEWGVYVSMDSVVKALSPDLERVAHCWFHSGDVTYFNLMRAPSSAAEAAPYQPLRQDGSALPWRVVGNLVIAYLSPSVPARAARPMTYLRLHDGRFEDVSDDVAAGRVPVEAR